MYTSLKKLSNLLILKQEGTSRQERYTPALHENETLMDNRSMQDIIAYMQRFAKNLLFINPDEDEIKFNESWEYFFKNDILFLIAGISTKKTSEIKETYDRLQEIFAQDKTVENFLELAQFAFSRLKKIDEWYKKSVSDPSLKQYFTLYIRSYLQDELKIIRELLMYSLNQLDDREKTDRFRNDLMNMHDIWSLPDKENISIREKIFAGRDDQEKLSHASHELHKTFDTIFHATETLVEKCAVYFEEAIRSDQHYSEGHNPHVALVIAFLKLYQYAKEDLNKIPQRHLHFYYSDVLRIAEKKAIPDQTFVVFELVKGFDTAMIKKGTQLSAGKDKKNKELIYETEKDIVIHRAQVSSLHTIFIERNDNKQVLNYYRETLPQKTGQGPASIPATAVSKIFGEPKAEAITGIGFAIASAQLYLAKGERQVTITFESPVDIEPCPPFQKEPVEVFDISIIRLLLTGEKGWVDSDDPASGIQITSLKKTGAAGIELNFTISIRQEQAITAFNNKFHEGAFVTAFPVLQCMLKYPQAQSEEEPDKRKAQIGQLCILQNLQVVIVRIMVQVGSIQSKASFDGVRDLILENDESALDHKKPFFPFTSVPKVGSSFFIGCKDFFYKEIQHLFVNMEWILPDNFSTYYQRYLPPYDQNKFTASLSILEGKQWKKIYDTFVIDANSGNPRFRSVELHTGNVKQDKASPSGNAIASYDDMKKDGTLRFKLGYPDFGHTVYPQLITSAVMEGAQRKSGGPDYYNIIRRQLNDSVISIKYPDDIRQRNGSLKVIYNIAENTGTITPEKARGMMINALGDVIRKFNIDNLITRIPGDINEEGDDGPGRMLVNDPNWIDRVLGIFRNIGLIDKDIHYDEDKDELDDVADKLRDKVHRKADFIMPSDNELIGLIENETSTAINKTVAKIVDEILVLIKQGTLDLNIVGNLVENEFKEVNRVINDMIAKKITTHITVNEIPPPPYTPLVNNISVSYSSVKELSGRQQDKVFHITPFGTIETGLLNTYSGNGEADVSASYNRLFPERLISPDKNYQGMLFIGIDNVLPGYHLSLLMQLAEGPKWNDRKAPVIHWFYFRNNAWIRLSNDNIISDSTFGLQATGIIEFSIPGDACGVNNLFDSDSLYWLCAAVEEDTDAFSNLINITSQAALVTFKDHINNPEHLALPLAAEQIKTLIDEVPQVKKVSQPVSSFNGKVGENDSEYYTRISERLRHKSRAINNWDYERLVLEEFPAFYKVKCLNNYYNGDFATGHVTVVPIADFRNKKYAGSNMLLPKISYMDLRKVEQFLSAKSSPFVKLHAVNPLLEHVLISGKVKFHGHINKGFYLKKLNEDLIGFLTPWAGGDSDTVSFSAKIYYSSIVNFIDRQEYVNYVVDLVMEQYSEKDNGEKVFVRNPAQLTALVETELKTGHSILVSAPRHFIELAE